MKKYLYIFLLLIELVSCTEYSLEEQRGGNAMIPKDIKLSVEANQSDTRVQISDYGTCWSTGDMVSVFYMSENNQKWKCNGGDGSLYSSFSYVSGELGGQTSELITILYPYNQSATLDSDTQHVTTLLPNKQNYLQDSYALNGNIMVASGEDTSFILRSVCGWLRLSIVGNGEVVDSVILKGNNGEHIAGEIVVDATSADYNLLSGGDAYKTIKLDCSAGVKLSKKVTHFYIGVLPQEFEKGITMAVTFKGNKSNLELSTSSSLNVRRNHVVPMECVYTHGHSTVPNNQIWYTAPYKMDDYNPIVENATMISHEYDDETNFGILEYDTDVTTLINNIYSTIISIYLPGSVKSIGNHFLENQPYLQDVYLAEGLEYIGDYAFANCTRLKSIKIPSTVNRVGNNPFKGCVNLTTFLGNHTSNDGHCLIINNKLVSYISKGNTVYSIPIGVRVIGTHAFYDADELVSVKLPNGVDEVKPLSFFGCDSLAMFKGKYASNDGRCLIDGSSLIAFAAAGLDEYVIEDGVTHIADMVFYGSALHSVTLPESIQNIGDQAFDEIPNLHVYCKPTTPPYIEYAPFSNSSEIYVPFEAYDAYMESLWSQYYIYSYNFATGEVINGWKAMEDYGIYFDDCLCYIFADPTPYQGTGVYVRFEYNVANENYIRVVDPFSLDNIAAMWGDIPSWMGFHAVGRPYLEFDITDPDNVQILNGVELSDDTNTYIAYMMNIYVDPYDLCFLWNTNYPIRLVDGAIKFPTEGMRLSAFMDGAYVGDFAEVNTKGYMQYYLPGTL